MSTKRINLEVDLEIHERLKRLKDRMECTSQAECFRRMLSLMEFTQSAVIEDGGELQLKRKDGKIERIHLL